jgi:hypothetical protein
VPSDDFAEEADRRWPSGASTALSAYCPLLQGNVHHRVGLDSTMSSARLRELHLDIPAVDNSWLAAVLADGVARGYFPPPATTRAAEVVA